MKRFEVLWFEGEDEQVMTKEFSTLQSAMNFYNRHKDSSCKSGWWVTKRNKDWEVIEDYVY